MNNKIEEIYNKYHKTINIKIKQYNKIYNIDKKELQNEIRLTIYKVLQKNISKETQYTYINKSIDNTIKNYIRNNNTKKEKKNKSTIPLSSVISLVGDNKYNPEYQYIKEENYNNMMKKIINKLTWKEELIFILKEQNFTNKEISEITDNSLKTVYNILNKIKEKYQMCVK